MLKKYSKAFTLIELLVVIGILGILLAIVLIAINPARQFAQADNTKRASDINTILNAIHQFSADNRGALPPGMPARAAVGATPPPTGVEITDDAATTPKADICKDISPTYVSALPVDPGVKGVSTDSGNGVAVVDCAATYHTGYSVWVDSAGRVTIFADKTDVTVAPKIISITR